MKKVILVVLAVGLAAGLGSRQALAQDKKVEFSLNAGIMTLLESTEDWDVGGLVLVALSPQLDIHGGRNFMVSPEAMVVTNFQFSGVVAFPGVILNYLGKGFFAGAGAVVGIGGGGAMVLPKINIGYRLKHINLTAYLITSFEELFSESLVGATVGYRF